MGRIDLEAGNVSRAVERSYAALSLLPHQAADHYIPLGEDHALFYEPLARAYFGSGDLEKARETYEKIKSLTSGRIHFGDIYAKSFYMLGRIFEKQGKKAEASASCQRFHDL